MTSISATRPPPLAFAPDPLRERLDLRPGLGGAVWCYPTEMNSGSPMRHRHDELELNVVRSGSAVYEVGGKGLKLAPGELVWLFPEQSHLLSQMSADFSMWILVAEPALLERCCSTTETWVLRASAPPGWLSPARASAGRLRWLEDRLREIASSAGDPARHASGLAYVLLSAWSETVAAARDRHVDPVVAGALRRLQEEPERWSVPMLARAGGVSAGHLRRLFAREVGQGVVACRNALLLGRFLDVYGRGDRLSITDAAYVAGFGSYAQFHRVFTASLGCSPREHLHSAPAARSATTRGETA